MFGQCRSTSMRVLVALKCTARIGECRAREGPMMYVRCIVFQLCYRACLRTLQYISHCSDPRCKGCCVCCLLRLPRRCFLHLLQLLLPEIIGEIRTKEIRRTRGFWRWEETDVRRGRRLSSKVALFGQVFPNEHYCTKVVLKKFQGQRMNIWPQIGLGEAVSRPLRPAKNSENSIPRPLLKKFLSVARFSLFVVSVSPELVHGILLVHEPVEQGHDHHEEVSADHALKSNAENQLATFMHVSKERGAISQAGKPTASNTMPMSFCVDILESI